MTRRRSVVLTFPTEDELAEGIDAWELLPNVCDDEVLGHIVRITVTVLD